MKNCGGMANNSCLPAQLWAQFSARAILKELATCWLSKTAMCMTGLSCWSYCTCIMLKDAGYCVKAFHSQNYIILTAGVENTHTFKKKYGGQIFFFSMLWLNVKHKRINYVMIGAQGE